MLDSNTADLKEYEHRLDELDDFYRQNRAEIRMRALQMALDSDDANDRIIDIIGDQKWGPEFIESMGTFVKYELIDKFEERAELELREELGL